MAGLFQSTTANLMGRPCDNQWHFAIPGQIAQPIRVNLRPDIILRISMHLPLRAVARPAYRKTFSTRLMIE
jgi:hypothetical protein